MVPPLRQNAVGICNQITLLTLYYINSRLITHFKIIDVPIQASDIFYLTVSFNYVNLTCQIFLLFVLGMYTNFASSLFRLCILLWFWFYNHCILTCFLSSKNGKHCSPNYGLRFFSSYRPSQSLPEILKFSFMFPNTYLYLCYHLSSP
jgi:hypothetical protein